MSGSLRRLGALVFCVLPVLACTSTQLETASTHPASAEALAAPLTPVGGALEPNFEPQAAAPAGVAPAAGGHQHAPATSAPAAAEHQHAPSAAAPDDKAPPAATQWTCPMHPEIIRNEPGNCPICGMKLKPILPKDGVKGSP